ncbi:MAG: tetratricopeptide repeat protein [Candidatus Gastranaerophilales bacterium]|nr:tetratricopeptide repeat protein [Candidatus Gastranaerophilales bacterium]
MADINAILERAQALTDEEKFEEAYNVLTAAYNQGKNNAEYLEKMALAAQTLEKTEEATKYWEELIEVAPNSIVAYSELQDIYNKTNRYKYYLTRAKVKTLNNQVSQSIPDYKKAIDNTQDIKEKDDAEVLMARAYEYIGKPLNAIDEYYKIASRAGSADIHLKIADLYIQGNDKFSAINALQQALEHYPDDNRVKEFLAKLYVETGEIDKAQEYAVSDLLKIKIKLMQGNNSEAFELLQNVSDKNNGEYHKLLAEYYYNNKDWDNCNKAIDDFAKFEPVHPLIFQMRSLVCESNNDMHAAHVNRAKMYLAKGQEDVSLHEFMLAHNIDKNNIQTIEDIIALCENNGEKHTAAEFYEKLLALDPKNERALVKSGDFYFDLGEYQTASKYYERAAEVSRLSETFLKAGKCFEKLKKEKIAKEYYEKYLAKAPMSAEVELIKAKMAKLSDKDVTESDEGFLEKILGFFSKK